LIRLSAGSMFHPRLGIAAICCNYLYDCTVTTTHAFQLATSQVLLQLTFAASCNPYKLRTVSGSEYVAMEKTPKCFTENKENWNN